MPKFMSKIKAHTLSYFTRFKKNIGLAIWIPVAKSIKLLGYLR